jgi:hypothetical protein
MISGLHCCFPYDRSHTNHLILLRPVRFYLQMDSKDWRLWVPNSNILAQLLEIFLSTVQIKFVWAINVFAAYWAYLHKHGSHIFLFRRGIFSLGYLYIIWSRGTFCPVIPLKNTKRLRDKMQTFCLVQYEPFISFVYSNLTLVTGVIKFCFVWPKISTQNLAWVELKKNLVNHLGGGPVVRVWDQEVSSLCGLRFEPCSCSYDGHRRLTWSLTLWPVGLVKMRAS